MTEPTENPVRALEADRLCGLLNDNFELAQALRAALERRGGEQALPLTDEQFAAPFTEAKKQIDAYAACTQGRLACDFGENIAALEKRFTAFTAEKTLKAAETSSDYQIKQAVLGPVKQAQQMARELEAVLSGPSLPRNAFLETLGLYSPGAAENPEELQQNTAAFLAALARGEALDEVRAALHAAHAEQVRQAEAQARAESEAQQQEALAPDPYENITGLLNILGQFDLEADDLTADQVHEALERHPAAKALVESAEGQERIIQAVATLRALDREEVQARLAALAPRFGSKYSERPGDIAHIIGEDPRRALKDLPALLDTITGKEATVAPAAEAEAPEAEAEPHIRPTGHGAQQVMGGVEAEQPVQAAEVGTTEAGATEVGPQTPPQPQRNLTPPPSSMVARYGPRESRQPTGAGMGTP